MTLGERIKLLRELLGMTQPELAEAVGVTKQSISRYEKHIDTPNSLVLAEIAKTLDCSADYLLGLSDENGRRA